jgi:hypothetical protein
LVLNQFPKKHFSFITEALSFFGYFLCPEIKSILFYIKVHKSLRTNCGYIKKESMKSWDIFRSITNSLLSHKIKRNLGTVLDKTQQPLAFVVSVQNTNAMQLTETDGKFISTT